jgi:hypothetical protein
VYGAASLWEKVVVLPVQYEPVSPRGGKNTGKNKQK